MTRIALLMAALCAVLACAAPASSAGQPASRLPDSEVGRVAGTRAYVGLSLDRGILRAYVCDGTLSRPATIARWFRGRWDGRHARTFATPAARLHVEAIRPDGTIAGHLRALGGPHPFHVRPAGGRAGLYEGVGTPRAGWIVLGDGSLRGTFVPTRPPRCRAVLVTGSSGSSQWVTVC